MRVTTQPDKAISTKVATQFVEASGARPVVNPQSYGTGSEAVRPVGQSLSGDLPLIYLLITYIIFFIWKNTIFLVNSLPYF